MKIKTLKKKRLEKGFKQADIAEEAKKSIRTYQDYEAGEYLPDVLTAIRMAKKLDIESLQELEDLFSIPQRQLRDASPSKKVHKNISMKI